MNAQETQQALAAQANGHHRPPSSEATKVEQSRAIAQVQGALLVAMQNPRDELRAIERMRDACGQFQLADNAFFKYSRGGSTVTGPSIHLATELARCWGNIEYGVSEMRRDDASGASEMASYAWDQETNNRVTTTFIVPHKRDKRGGAVPLVDLRDIYENNANNAARRLRECILRVLPKAFVEEAKTLCMRTLEHGGDVPLNERRAKLLEAFASLGVTKAQIEHKVGRKADALTGLDLGVLRVTFTSLKRGETTVEDEFQVDQTEEVAAQIEAQAKAAKKPAARKAKKLPDPIPAEPVENEASASDKPSGQMTTDEFQYFLDQVQKTHSSIGAKGFEVYRNSPSFKDPYARLTEKQKTSFDEWVGALTKGDATS